MTRVAVVLTGLWMVLVAVLWPTSALSQTPQAARVVGIQAPPVKIPATRVPRLATASVVTIPLNQVGIFDADYLNPRNPPNVLHPQRGQGADPGTGSQTSLRRLNEPHNRGDVLLGASDVSSAVAAFEKLVIMFDNRTSTHSMLVGFPVPKDSQEVARAAGVYVGTCKGDVCPARVQISPRAAARIPLQAFVTLKAFRDLMESMQTAHRSEPAPSQKPVQFTVSFVEETAEPSQPKGYFSVVPLEYLGELDGSTTWSTVASVSGAIEPDTGGDKMTFSTEKPYPGGRDRRFAGSGELRVKQPLGSRADADLTIGYKDGSLGEKDQKGTLNATKYRVNVYAMTGMTLSFGKFTFASPTSGVAVRAKGEGFRLAFRNAAVSHIVVRESADGDANHDNFDNRQLLAEVNNLALPRSGIFRSANVVLLYGREHLALAATDDKPAVVPHSYLTLGGEAFFASAPDVPWQASLAWYGSRARAISESVYAPATGQVTYGTASWSFLDRSEATTEMPKKARVNATITVQAGIGSRSHDDDLATGENHAYVGEQTGFSPDTLLLSRFGKKLRATGWQPNLGNKTYTSLAYTDQRFSPLGWVARGLQILSSDIANKSTTVQWHHYSLRQPWSASGHEIGTRWTIETPAGIESTLQLSYFWPRGALKPLFHVKPWAIVTTVKVTI